MSTFFGIPTEWLALSCLALVAAMLAVLGIRAWRWPIFLRLGVRQLPRRPQQTVLITAGLMLSTALVTASLVTGDTITHALRSAAVNELGRVDEIVMYSEVPRPPPGATAGSTAPASPASSSAQEDNQRFVSPPFFPGPTYERLAGRLSDNGALQNEVAGIVPAIRLWCTVVNVTSRQTSNADVVAIPADYDRIFGELLRADGRRLDLGTLLPDEVFLNDSAGRALVAKPGDELTCTIAGVPHRWTVADTALPEGLGRGSLASLYLPLDHLRASLGPAVIGGVEAPINQIWVANRGDAISSARLTETVISALRPAIADPAALEEVKSLLQREDLRAALAVRRGTLPDRTQQRVAEVLASVDQPAEHFERLLRNVALRRALLEGAVAAPDPQLAIRLTDSLQRATGYRIEPIKQQVLEFAERAGNVITTIFLLFSLLSIAASVLLIFLIFSLLAASRRSELGVTRALGTERGHLIAMFTYEGVAYALLAAAAGVPAGLAVSRLLLAILIRSVESGAAGFTGAAARVAETVTWHAEPRSVLLGATLGLALTIITVAAAAWRVSRLTIVTAIRDLPEPPPARYGRGAWWWVGLIVLGAVLLGVALGLGQALPFAAGVSCLVLATGAAIRHGGRRRWGRDTAGQLGATVAGAGLAAYWALPFDAPQRIGLPPLASGIEIFALAGVVMVAGAVWVFVANGDLFGRAMTRFLSLVAHPAPALRLALAHIFRQPLRTGLTAMMFGLVIFMLTVMQTVTASAVHFHANPEVVYGGWHLIGETRATTRAMDGAENATFSRLPDAVAAAALARSDLRPLVEATGARTTAFFALLQLSAPSPAWGGYIVAGIDRHFAEGNLIPLQTRAKGYRSDREVWEAVATTPGLAVVDNQVLPSPQVRGRPRIGAASFVLHGVTDGQAEMEPVSVWIGNPTGKQAAKVQVIGIIDRRTAASFRGLHIAQAQLEALGPPVRPPATRLYFRLHQGVPVDEARAVLGTSFFDEGLQTINVLERFQNESGPLLLSSLMLQLFVGLGLFVGVAALGVISTRAALERRQEIGMLRAIGFSRGTVARSVLFESVLVVVLGSTLGVGLGLLLCRNVFAVQFFDRFQRGLQLVVPWDQLALTVSLACAAALLATWLPARQASRVPPIAALREG
jgi:putative ABC transport system permease protein